jgi:hypothetical protein
VGSQMPGPPFRRSYFQSVAGATSLILLSVCLERWANFGGLFPWRLSTYFSLQFLWRSRKSPIMPCTCKHPRMFVLFPAISAIPPNLWRSLSHRTSIFESRLLYNVTNS